MMDSIVKATVSHQQVINGRAYKPGMQVQLDPDLARTLQARGAITIKSKPPIAEVDLIMKETQE